MTTFVLWPNSFYKLTSIRSDLIVSTATAISIENDETKRKRDIVNKSISVRTRELGFVTKKDFAVLIVLRAHANKNRFFSTLSIQNMQKLCVCCSYPYMLGKLTFIELKIVF